jgi:hypothetical protein
MSDEQITLNLTNDEAHALLADLHKINPESDIVGRLAARLMRYDLARQPVIATRSPSDELGSSAAALTRKYRSRLE